MAAMAVKAVLKMGHPLLRLVAAPVRAFDAAQINALLSTWKTPCAPCNGAGIAAPQIGVSLRVVIFEMRKTPAIRMSRRFPSPC